MYSLAGGAAPAASAVHRRVTYTQVTQNTVGTRARDTPCWGLLREEGGMASKGLRLWWIVSEIAYTYNMLECKREGQGKRGTARPPPQQVHGGS